MSLFLLYHHHLLVVGFCTQYILLFGRASAPTPVSTTHQKPRALWSIIDPMPPHQQMCHPLFPPLQECSTLWTTGIQTWSRVIVLGMHLFPLCHSPLPLPHPLLTPHPFTTTPLQWLGDPHWCNASIPRVRLGDPLTLNLLSQAPSHKRPSVPPQDSGSPNNNNNNNNNNNHTNRTQKGSQR